MAFKQRLENRPPGRRCSSVTGMPGVTPMLLSRSSRDALRVWIETTVPDWPGRIWLSRRVTAGAP